LDTETTGFDCETDEIIQVAFIDGEGNELLYTYVKPYVATKWDMAEKVNGISPSMVSNSPYPRDLVPAVQKIINGADIIIGYNLSFDISFLEKWGLVFPDDKKYVDVMYQFAEVYGDWSNYFQSYKFQKLTSAAHYYGYNFDGHDCLEDVKGTLVVYYQIQKGANAFNWFENNVLDQKGNVVLVTDDLEQACKECEKIHGEILREKIIRVRKKQGLDFAHFIKSRYD
jgi:DNA polymerase-3 subunit epsilon